MTDASLSPTAPAERLWPRLVRWEWILLVVVLVAIVVTRFPSLDQRLLETHAFRQTQTAFQTVGFHESGIDLLRPEVPVLGSPWTIPFEFPLFQALASVPMSWGLGADAANRVTALGFFVVTAGALWALVRLVASRRIAAIALVVFSFSPFSLLWSRASVMEYLATAAALGWVIAAVRLRQTSDNRWAVAGALLGVVAAMVKVTTAMVWVVPILLFEPAERATEFRSWLRDRLQPTYLVVLAIPALASVAWTLHVDAVKGASAATSSLTSSALAGWNFGGITQRLNISDLGAVVDRIDSLVLGRGWVVVGVLAVVALRRHRAMWVGISLVPLLAVEIFFNLYVVHDYYLIAVTPALAAILALGINALAGWVRIPARRQGMGLALIVLLWVGLNLALTQSYWNVAYDDFAVPGASQEIEMLAAPGEYAMVHPDHDDSASWSPALLYYADRRGMVLADFITIPIMASQPDLDRYSLLWTDEPEGSTIEFAALRPWFAPVSSQSLVLGATSADLGDVGFLASTGEVLPEGPYELLSLERDSVICDGKDEIEIPAGAGSAWLSISTQGEARARLRSGLATVPSAARTLVWNRTSDDGMREAQQLTCVGGGSITINAAVDPVYGLLRVATDPPVPTQILVNGDPIGDWDSGWLKLPPGDYEISFADVAGFATPAAQMVTVADGTTAEVSGVFAERGWLRVVTDPAVSATISVDGAVQGDSGVWTELDVGSHEVCILDEGYVTIPICQAAIVTAGDTATIGFGSLRVATSPSVPAQILVDGVAYDSWSLDRLTLAEGDYEVSFSGVSGFSRPDAVTVTVVAGATTEVTGVFEARGWLQVATSPEVPALILVDGVPYASWGLDRLMLRPGDYVVSFSDVDGFTTPDPQTVTMTAGGRTEVAGEFVLQGSLQVITDPAVPSQILVDGVAVGEWGAWIDLSAGNHEVCFGEVTGLAAPACETTTVVAGQTAVVTGVFTGFP